MKVKLITTKDPKKVPKALREKSEKIREINPELLKLAEEMKVIMNKNNGIGLAAIQVGIPIRMIVVKDSEGDHILINPEIKKLSKKLCKYSEGCLSFPELFEEIERPERVIVHAENPEGQLLEIDTEGILARVLQHEIDHLEGVVFMDHIGENSSFG
jgi:peptide deformylase